MRSPTVAELEGWMAIPYVKRGRLLTGADCWGLVRLGRLALRGDLLPSYDSIDAEDKADLPAVSADFLCLSHRVVEPMDGAIAFVFERGACFHAGLVVSVDGRVCVIETNEKTGPRYMPRRYFERIYGDVRYYDH